MILVTGASGFLGQHLTRYLSSKGKTIRALYNNHPPEDSLTGLPGVSWMKCDLLDVYDVESVMLGIDFVYHCAAIVSFDSSDKERMLHFNPESTANIVNESLVRGIKKMVYVSSVAALGRTAENKKQITEEEQWSDNKQNSVYGLSKYLAEMEVWRGMGEGLNAVIANPGIILGEGDLTGPAAQLVNVIKRGFPFYTTGVNSWVDVRDVVQLLYQLMESDVDNERFIISSANSSYKTVIELIAESLNKKAPRFKANETMATMAWVWSSLSNRFLGHKKIVTRETAGTALQEVYYSNEKLLKVFPDFEYRPLTETIKSMINKM